jgi:hypothetical protein
MPEDRLHQQLCRKDFDKNELADRAVQSPELLSELFEGLNVDKAAVRYGCEKILRLISETKPSVLYPHIDIFLHLLDSENNILKWGAIQVVGNLATVDSEGKIDRILEKFLSPIRGPVMITAGNTLIGAAKIVCAKPALAGKIVREMLKVEQANYKTPECRNIAIGHAINALDLCWMQIPDKQLVVEFIQRQLNNSRNATKQKAETALKKYKKG